MMTKADFHLKIEDNIAAHGYHVTVVTGGALPRYAYTIGCKETIGAEFILAGGEYYSQTQVGEIIAGITSHAREETDWQHLSLQLGSLGTFSVARADPSWSSLLLLGVADYYGQADIPVWQILPDNEHRTLDVPDMSQAFEAATQPVWHWLVREWDYPVPAGSMAFTNVDVLFGEPVTEVTRWEQGEWEIFAGAGPDVPVEKMRAVPLGVLLGIDKTLEAATLLPIEKGLWRDAEELEWNDWG